MEAELRPLPCPFCGMENSVGVQQGSTFRWVAAYCGACEAKGPEERREKYTGEISDSDRAIALEAWNRRPSVPQRERRPCEDTCELSSLLRETEAQERRLAEALIDYHEALERAGSTCNPRCPLCLRKREVAEARAILAAPAPDPKASEDAPLRCELSEGAIVIRVGERIIARGVDYLPSLYDGENDRPLYRVTDPSLFAAAVVAEVDGEGEDGSTPLTRFLDSMIEEAIEQGADGIEETVVAPSKAVR